MRTMTITEALVELKLLDKRIANSDMQDWCIVQMKQNKKTMTGETVEEYEQETKARFQSVKDLITERANIKKAIVKSNAETMVAIGDLKMTVAEAIEYKTSIEYEKRLLQSLRRSKAEVEEGKIAHEARLDREVSNVIGKLAESGKDNLSEEQKNFTESYRQMNEAIIIDPIDIDKQISELETKIESFEQNIDVALSVSNATTFIEIYPQCTNSGFLPQNGHKPSFRPFYVQVAIMTAMYESIVSVPTSKFAHGFHRMLSLNS